MNLHYLITGHIADSLSYKEKLQLLEAWNDPDSMEQIKEIIWDLYSHAAPGNFEYDEAKVERMIKSILENVPSISTRPAEIDQVFSKSPISIITENTGTESHTPVFSILNNIWFRYAAAVLIFFGIGLIVYKKFTSHQLPLAKVTSHSSGDSSDVLPGSAKAILTLSNGEKVELSQAGQQIISDSGVTIKNKNGQVSYGESDVVELNTMSTPKGGQYKITLSDGTKVWLNAASSITYPTSFSEKIRSVSITGEAFFEVTKNPNRPFVVKTYKDEIMVKGTSFNVNSYTDEPAVKTSLLEGIVQINETLLKPGHAYIAGKIIPADLDQDLAWKNGVFNFHHVKLADAMRQIARWYDIDVNYEGKVGNIELGGNIGRGLSLKQLLSGLEDTDIHFRLQGRVLTVY